MVTCPSAMIAVGGSRGLQNGKLRCSLLEVSVEGAVRCAGRLGLAPILRCELGMSNLGALVCL
jgi:hypothetical protein